MLWRDWLLNPTFIPFLSPIQGNYKGVMLCNRPFAGASGAAAKQASGTTSFGSFKCGTVDTPLGENVKISEHQKMVAKVRCRGRERAGGGGGRDEARSKGWE